MGGLNVREGYAEFRGYLTWFRVTGELMAKNSPVVILHGGPGAAHDYTDSLKNLVVGGRAVIQYDQLGCGRSTHLWQKPRRRACEPPTQRLTCPGDRGFATLDGTVGEGGEPAAPSLAAGCAGDAAETRKGGTMNSSEYNTAMQVFYDRHVCRVKPLPAEVARSFAQIAADPTVYHTMNGPSEFHVIGSLKGWNIISQVGRIKAPTLLISGRYDEATPAVVQPFVDGIAGARWEIFEESSHIPHVEEQERCLRIIGDFLAEHDRPARRRVDTIKAK